MIKSIQLLYNGDNEFCKETFKEYLESSVLKANRESDGALRKFFKGVLQRFSEEYPTSSAQSKIIEIYDKL